MSSSPRSIWQRTTSARAGSILPAGRFRTRLDYTLQTAADFVTSRLYVVSRGEGWRRAIELLRDGQGIWTVRTEEGRVVSICRRLAAILPGSPTRWIATSVSLP